MWRSTTAGAGLARPARRSLRVETVGICGSDLHLYRDELGDSHVGLLPRIMGHEFSAVVEQIDPAGSDFQPGDRVAMWPMLPCGRCHTCRDGRPNVCADLRIIGVHDDGALQERFVVPTANLVATPDLSARQASLIEPVAVSVHAINRGRVDTGEHVVVLGAGPIGAAAALAAVDRGADVLVLDPVATRRELLSSWASPPSGLATMRCRRGSPNTAARTDPRRHRHDRPGGGPRHGDHRRSPWRAHRRRRPDG